MTPMTPMTGGGGGDGNLMAAIFRAIYRFAFNALAWIELASPLLLAALVGAYLESVRRGLGKFNRLFFIASGVFAGAMFAPLIASWLGLTDTHLIAGIAAFLGTVNGEVLDFFWSILYKKLGIDRRTDDLK